ncbi:MAG: outer membrane protein assembly factor BamA [Xanthomonadales bacterium]|nr:outer membrane protein assembly factor BamA [Xanthomonadales bacterium]
MKRIAALIFCCVLSGTAPAWDSFTISDIRIEGLQRMSDGTVLNYLPLDIGDELTTANSRAAIRELYATGFFDDIQLGREGNILVITIQERPSISSISLVGNKAIKDEDMLSVLADIGLAEGEVYSPQALDRITQGLISQYNEQGRYAVDVRTRVTDLERNRVRISIIIDEGKTAQIRHINIVGNTLFTDEEIRSEFESDIPPFWKFWSKDDQYTQEKLSGDLEKVRSYYQDRGYIDASVESAQVSISPDKREIFITANVTEGELFTVRDVSVTGDMVIPESSIRQLIVNQSGEVFSRKKMEQSVENITSILSNIGYAFANVNPIPQIDRGTREVDLNFYVQPGKRVYVRRVQFTGNVTSKDEVIRREMRQFEGAWFSQAAIDRSKLRLQRLTYFESVDIETPPVPGTDDQVDVIVNVEERPAGSFSIGLGFSEIQGLIYSLSVQQDNFLGSGNRVGIGLSSSDIISSINLSFEDPYWTDEGISRGFYARYQEFDQGAANISSFTSSEAAAGVSIGAPLSELDFVRLGLGVRSTDINIGQFTFEFESIIDPDGDPNDPDNRICQDFNMNGICPETYYQVQLQDPLSTSLDFNNDGLLSADEREFDVVDFTATWSRDSRNHFLNPTQGSLQRVSVEASLPGSTREYWKLFYRYAKYIPIWRDMTFSFHGDIGYGDAYDDYDMRSQAEPIDPTINEALRGQCLQEEVIDLDRGLPFFEHFYGGGVKDIRGFDDNTLGPKDPFCRSVGGDLKVSGGIEIAIPTPFTSGSGSRIALFVDVGNVYEDLDSFDTDLFRASVGLSVTWQAPVGPIIMNFARPIKELEGDRTESIQFSFGTTF